MNYGSGSGAGFGFGTNRKWNKKSKNQKWNVNFFSWEIMLLVCKTDREILDVEKLFGDRTGTETFQNRNRNRNKSLRFHNTDGKISL
jgi:hypothetical protein